MKPLSKMNLEALAGFRYELRRFVRSSEEAARRVGLTPQQYQCLLAIEGFPQRDCVNMTELAERMQIRHHTGVGLVDRLIEQKLASRTPSNQDRRQIIIRLTPLAKRLLRKLSSAHLRQLDQMAVAPWASRATSSESIVPEKYILSAVVEADDDAIITKTLNGIVTRWNPGAEQLFGYASQEMIGQQITKIFPRDRIDEEEEILVQVRKGIRIEKLVTRRLSKDGRSVCVVVSIWPVVDEFKRVLGAAKIVRAEVTSDGFQRDRSSQVGSGGT
jgi:PAS domain S-box-containing protein